MANNQVDADTNSDFLVCKLDKGPDQVFPLIATAIADAPASRVGSAVLSWDPNGERDLAGYRVYVGTASRTYGTPLTAGMSTTYTVAELEEGGYVLFRRDCLQQRWLGEPHVERGLTTVRYRRRRRA
jgi:hypothetical protein